MRKLVLLLIALLLPIIVGCGHSTADEDSSIQITEQDIVRSDRSFEGAMIECWEPVFLDYEGNGLIADIYDVKYDDNLLFIESGAGNNQAIKVFDKSGTYLHDISRRGRAKNEFAGIACWTIDPIRNEVLIFDYAPVIKYYDYGGNYLREIEYDDHISGFLPENPTCLSDGTVIGHYYLSTFTTPEYRLFHTDGTVSVLFETNGCKLQADNPDECLPFWREYDSFDGEAWLMCRFNNHIYRITGADSVSCIANLSFIDVVPENVRTCFNIQRDGPKYYTRILSSCLNLKDYFLFEYCDMRMILDKSSMKVYQFNDEDKEVYVPEHYECAYSDNTIVAGVPFQAEEQIAFMDSPDYDHSYPAEIETFYRKVADWDNPVMILCHLKQPDSLK